jgi:hypothetical protein
MYTGYEGLMFATATPTRNVVAGLRADAVLESNSVPHSATATSVVQRPGAGGKE